MQLSTENKDENIIIATVTGTEYHLHIFSVHYGMLGVQSHQQFSNPVSSGKAFLL